MKKKYLLGNNVENNYYTFFFFAAVMAVFLLRLFHLSDLATTWDEVDFSLGVEHFSLSDMQPHFPGYPFFILGGMLFHTFIDSTAAALSSWNLILLLSSVFPIYKLSGFFLSDRNDRMAVILLVITLPYMWLSSTEPMSEGMAIGILWWYLWSLVYSFKHDGLMRKCLPFLFFGILMGVRLSYLPFVAGLFLLAAADWKKQRDLYRISVFFFAFFVFQWIWISSLIFSEGGFISFLHLAISFTSGHFTEWGGAVSSDSGSLLNRVVLFIQNGIFAALLGSSITVGFLYLLLFISGVISKRMKEMDNEKKTLTHLLWFLFVCYFLYVFFAQNVEKARHMLPLANLFSFLIGIHILKLNQKTGRVLLGLLIVAQAFTGYLLLENERTAAPSIFQLQNYLAEKHEPLILYTWEETRVLEYNQAPFDSKRIWTYDLFVQDINAHAEKQIYLTSKVIEGFKQQGVDVTGKVEHVKSFHSPIKTDPVYKNIELYKWRLN